MVANLTAGGTEEGAAVRVTSPSSVATVVVVVFGCGGRDVMSDAATIPEIVGFGTDVPTDDPHAAMVAARTIVVTARTIIARV